MSSRLRKGDRVRDKFKLPRPGDECVTGTVLSASRSVRVKWDDDSEMRFDHKAAEELLEKIK